MKTFFYSSILPVTILLWSVITQTQKNNACSDAISYVFGSFSENCYHIPDNGDEPIEIIKRHTGLGESHRVTTEDGYILTLFRIPQKNPKGVVFLQHGILQDSRVWLAQYNQSVALLFWKNGYDVWLGNSRGSSYSKSHVNSTIGEEDYWNFSFHEMGYYDHDAAINYIKEVTKVPKIVYVGFSLGTTSGLVYASMRPEASAKSLKAIVLLAPYTFAIKDMTISKEIMNGFPYFIVRNKLNHYLKFHYWFDYDAWYLKFLRMLNRIMPFKKLNAYFIALADGGDPDEVDPNLYSLMIDQYGSATSLKTSSHVYQLEYSEGKFEMYDYDRSKNLELYGDTNPPLYSLKKINVPIFSLYGTEDKISRPYDVEAFYALLSDVAKGDGKLLKIEGYSHHDFLFGIHRNEKVFGAVFEFLRSFN